MPSMNLQDKGFDAPHNPSGGLCREYRLYHATDFSQVLAAHAQLQAQNPTSRILMTMDDVSQALYTSGHARHSEDLGDGTGLDLSALDASCFEDGQYLGYLNHPSEWPVCWHNFQRLCEGVDFETACQRGVSFSVDDLATWRAQQQDPFSLYTSDDLPISYLVVPVQQSYDSLCAFPNGYFSCDFSPAENHALAKRWHDRYQLNLVGVGASYLGFIRAEPLDKNTAQQLAQDWLQLYDTSLEREDELDTATVLEHWTDGLTGQRWVGMRYSDAD